MTKKNKKTLKKTIEEKSGNADSTGDDSTVSLKIFYLSFECSIHFLLFKSTNLKTRERAHDLGSDTLRLRTNYAIGCEEEKTAKKKKEKEANLDILIDDSLGSEDVKGEEENGKDGGEVSSSPSHDHHSHQNPINGVEKSDQLNVVEEDCTEMILAANQKSEFEDETVIKIENDSKSEDDLPRQIVRIEHIESEKESNQGDDRSSSSSSSSSEDESQVTDAKSVVYNLALRTNTCDNKPDNSPAEVIQISDIAPAEEKINPLDQIDVMGNSSLPGNSAAEKTVYVVENEAIENYLSTPIDLIKHPVASTDFVSNKNDDSTIEESGEEVKVLSNVEKFSSEESLPSSCNPISPTSNGAESTKHDEISECSESQPLVAPAPRIAQRTSFWSCCGLFDALTGSNR